MAQLSKADALRTIQHRRNQIRAVFNQNISARELGRTLRDELSRSLLCGMLSDTELGMLSADYLNDILQNGWWSEVGRIHLRRLMESTAR